MQKPDFLYHASQDTAVRLFEPRAEKVRDPLEGPVVFATPDKAYASLFIVPATDTWTLRGRFSDRDPWHMIISDKERFISHDNGGALYELPSEQFATNPGQNMYGLEWISRQPVAPIAKETYKTGLQAMLELGVKIYFVDSQIFEAIRRSPDKGKTALRSLSPFEVRH